MTPWLGDSRPGVRRLPPTDASLLDPFPRVSSVFWGTVWAPLRCVVARVVGEEFLRVLAVIRDLFQRVTQVDEVGARFVVDDVEVLVVEVFE